MSSVLKDSFISEYKDYQRMENGTELKQTIDELFVELKKLKVYL